MSDALRIGIVGYGKIAQDQHAPSIAANPRFQLVATVSRSTDGAPNIPNFPSHTEMIGPLIEFLCQSTGLTFSCAVN